MTIEQLKEKQDKITHGIYQGQMRSYTNEHLTNLSVEYAISILDEINKGPFVHFEDGPQSTDSAIPTTCIYDKIQELKSLIK